MKTSIELRFHNSELGDGTIVLALKHDERNDEWGVNIAFSLHATRPAGYSPKGEWSATAWSGNYGYHLKLFATELRSLAESLEGVARMTNDDDFIVMHFQVVDKDAGKIGVSGFVSSRSSECSGVEWPFNPAPFMGFKFLFSDIWVHAHDLPAIADQIERFLDEAGVNVSENYWYS